MKNLFVQLAAYNVWANGVIVSLMAPLNPEIWHQQTPSSFDSLYKTVLHLLKTEQEWFKRIQHDQNNSDHISSAEPAFTDACQQWLQHSMQWEIYLKAEAVNETMLMDNIVYKNFRGVEFVQPLSEILLHVFNHSTYHRGQLVTMLRALGIDKISATDFIVWSRQPDRQ